MAINECSRKAIYFSGILSKLREVEDMINAEKYGGVQYDIDLKQRKKFLKEELDKLRQSDSVEVNVINRGCKYCGNGENLIEEFGIGIAKYLWVEDEKLSIEIYFEDGKDLVDNTNISYCPMCGGVLDE